MREHEKNDNDRNHFREISQSPAWLARDIKALK